MTGSVELWLAICGDLEGSFSKDCKIDCIILAGIETEDFAVLISSIAPIPTDLEIPPMLERGDKSVEIAGITFVLLD